MIRQGRGLDNDESAADPPIRSDPAPTRDSIGERPEPVAYEIVRQPVQSGTKSTRWPLPARPTRRPYSPPTLTENGDRYQEYRVAARTAHRNVRGVTEHARAQLRIVEGRELGAWVYAEVESMVPWPDELHAERVKDGLWRIYITAEAATRGYELRDSQVTEAVRSASSPGQAMLNLANALGVDLERLEGDRDRVKRAWRVYHDRFSWSDQ